MHPAENMTLLSNTSELAGPAGALAEANLFKKGTAVFSRP
jgi:hypothetical protein